MAYAIEAVRYGADGYISHLQWHQILKTLPFTRGPTETVPIADALAAFAQGEELFLFRHGALRGAIVAGRAYYGGMTLVSAAGANPGDSLANLPRF